MDFKRNKYKHSQITSSFVEHINASIRTILSNGAPQFTKKKKKKEPLTGSNPSFYLLRNQGQSQELQMKN